MRLLQVPGYGFPGLFAESFQTVRMGEAFAECGVDARIVYPWSSSNIAWSAVHDVYGVRHHPRRLVLPAIHVASPRALRSVSAVMVRLALAALALGITRDAVWLARHPRYDPLATLLRLRSRGKLRGRIFVELHEAQHWTPALDRNICGYIVISEPLREFLRLAGVAPARILLAPNGVDLRPFEVLHSCERRNLRHELGLPDDRHLICYTGQLGPGRNVETLIAALKHLDRRFSVVLVGGNRTEDRQRIETFIESQGLAERVIVRGHEPAQRTWRFQMAADALVIPYASYMAHAAWCSPLKLGEYLATGVPVVAFGLPSLRAALQDGDVVWASVETAPALAEAIAEATKRAPRRLEEVQRRLAGWSWNDRARRMAAFMGVAADAAARRAAD